MAMSTPNGSKTRIAVGNRPSAGTMGARGAEGGMLRKTSSEATATYAHQQLVECRFCHRTFAPEILARHEPVCQLASKPKRPPFSSQQQRIKDIEHLSGGSLSPVPIKAPPKNNWRQKHSELISSIVNGRMATEAISKGQPLPPPPPATVDPNYIMCQYCGRRFNESAAARHIPFCKAKYDNQIRPVTGARGEPTGGTNKQRAGPAPMAGARGAHTVSSEPTGGTNKQRAGPASSAGSTGSMKTCQSSTSSYGGPGRGTGMAKGSVVAHGNLPLQSKLPMKKR